jgi:very-short-patch-repair endonuclease
LRNYLEFAIRGPGALAERPAGAGLGVTAAGVTAAGGFERSVAAALRTHGWTVHPQVGVSGYRVDLGVVDPRAPGRYLLGIECDGPSYHSGATARDRDRLRQHVLESLGWNLARVWSTDWWLDREPPLNALLARLDALLRHEDAADESADEASAAPPAEPPASSSEAAEAAEALDAPAHPHAASLYLPVTLPKGDPERFYDPAAAAELRHQLHRIVHEEGPVAQGALFRRVIRAWGLARTGARIEKHLAALLPAQVRTTDEEDVFYWPEHLDPATWEGYRLPGAEAEAKRAIDEICLEELGNIALYVLGQQGGTTQAGLARAVCRLLGMARTGAEAEARIGRALGHGRVAGLVAVGDGVVSLVEPPAG